MASEEQIPLFRSHPKSGTVLYYPKVWPFQGPPPSLAILFALDRIPFKLRSLTRKLAVRIPCGLGFGLDSCGAVSRERGLQAQGTRGAGLLDTRHPAGGAPRPPPPLPAHRRLRALHLVAARRAPGPRRRPHSAAEFTQPRSGGPAAALSAWPRPVKGTSCKQFRK